MDESYTKQHLMDYIRFQLQNGYFIEDIVNTLIKYGYGQKLVDEVVYEIGDIEVKHHKHTKKTDLKQLDQELIAYTNTLLIDYIGQELEQGYTESAISRALLRQGHHKELIDAAFKAVKGGNIARNTPQPGISLPLTTLFIIAFILMTAVAFVISIGVNETIFMVGLTLAPAFIALALGYFLLASIDHKFMTTALPLLSIIMIIGVFAYLLNYSTVYTNKDPMILLGVNVVLGIIFSSFMAVFKRKSFQQPTRTKAREELQTITEKDIADAEKFTKSYDHKQTALVKELALGKDPKIPLKKMNEPSIRDDLDNRGGIP
ncbi:hypothetical protein HYY69_04955 [Candidatus Woesearchaeota archaeon]|nr:hypothetical protein [Candidatus Woesearchaeota archaeon]